MSGSLDEIWIGMRNFGKSGLQSMPITFKGEDDSFGIKNK